MRLSVNVAANVAAALVGSIVTLVITPVLVHQLGVTAYALVPLMAQIMLFITLPTVAINSMTSRYVMNELVAERREAARDFLSTSFVANLMALVLMVPIFVFLAVDAEDVFNIPNAHAAGFRWLVLWGLVGLSGTLATTVLSVRLFVVSAFAEQAIAGTAGALGRAGLILALFAFFEPKLFWVGVATAAGSWMTACLVWMLGRKLSPELKVSVARFNGGRLRRLATSGSWALVSQISFLLLSGGSLLVATALLGAEEAAPYALALAIPNLVSGIVATISNVFVPRLISHNVQKDKSALVDELLRGSRVVGFPVIVILAGVFVFGEQFYSVWVPSADAGLLRILTLIVLAPMAAFAVNGCLFSMYTVLDRLKLSAGVTLAAGVVSLCGTVLLVSLELFDPAVIAVPFATSSLMLLVNGIYHPVMVSQLIGVPRLVFIGEAFKMFVWLIIFCCVGFLCRGILGGQHGLVGLVLSGFSFVLLCGVLLLGVAAAQNRRPSPLGGR